MVDASSRGADDRTLGYFSPELQELPDVCVDGRTTSGGAARELSPVLAEAASLPT
jgi:hypothetical protein